MTSGTTWEHAHKGFVKSVKIVITLLSIQVNLDQDTSIPTVSAGLGVPGLQGQAGTAGEGGHLQQVKGLGDLFPPEQAVYAAGQRRPGVLPQCSQAGRI